jgi:shikimate dehydrogenase
MARWRRLAQREVCGEAGGMKRACVIGWPVAHSRSPLIHGYWLRRHGIDGSYHKEAVRPEEALAFLKSLRARGLDGCNVTVPHKRAALAVADRAEPAARASGAANTLWFEGDQLIADNTDGAGFIAHLRASAPHLALAGAPVGLLGAGGAARALTHALLEAGVLEVRVFNRTPENAEALALLFDRRVAAYDWRQREDRTRDVHLLINATALGMAGGEPLHMSVAHLPAAAVVADIVYVPLVTPLLAAARARGLGTLDGLGMLLHQAVPGFAKWFGVRPCVTRELYALVAADIEASRCS